MEVRKNSGNPGWIYDWFKPNGHFPSFSSMHLVYPGFSIALEEPSGQEPAKKL